MTDELNDEITLKEVIEIAKKYLLEFKSKFWIIAILGILFAGLLIWKEYNKETKYSSELTFMMKESGGGSPAGLSNFLGMVGLGGGGDSNLDKMKSIIKSRSLIKDVLFSKINIDGKEDYIANHIIKYEEIKYYSDSTNTSIFYFDSNDFGYTDRKKNEALLIIYSYIIGSKEKAGILNVSYDEISKIFSINGSFKNEALAVELIRELFVKIKTHYSEKVLKQNEATYTIVKNKYETISLSIKEKEMKFAKLTDGSRSQLLTVSKLPKEKLRKEIMILYEQLAQVIQLKEQAEFTLMTLTPSIEDIDQPIYPIFPSQKSYPKALIIGGFLGGFLAVLFIIMMTIYKDAMKD